MTVAIITPTYNRGDSGLLEKTILSVIGQSYEDFLYLIVDDGSTDSTSKIVKKYVNSDERIRYVYKDRQPNQKFGASPASNYGINLVLNESDLEYIAFLHSDDLLPINSIKKRMEVFKENQKALAVYGSMAYFSKGAILSQTLDAPKLDNPRKLSERLKSKKIWFPNHALMVHRDLLTLVKGYDENLGYGEDDDFSIRNLEKLNEGELCSVEDIVYYYRKHEDTVSNFYRERDLIRSDVDYLAKKHGIFGKKYIEALAYRAITRPHSLLPENIKKYLRPIRKLLTDRKHKLDHLIEEIESKN